MKIEMDWTPVHLKPLLDYMNKVSEKEYQMLTPYFDIGKTKSREVILKSGTVEIESRFILEGMIGKFYRGKLMRLYVKGDVCVEMESYMNQQPSRFEMKVLQAAKYTRLSYQNANMILDQFPEFMDLSDELYRIARYREQEWEGILNLPFDQGRAELKKKFPGIEAILTQKQLADLLGVDRKTISRMNKKDLATARYSRIIKYYRENLSYPFESKIHQSVELVDNHTLVWGSVFQKIFTGTRDEGIYKKSQLSWLSARLYPDARRENLLWLAKLYALLFAMDDFTDQLPNGMKAEVWEEISCAIYGVLEGNNCMILPQSIQAYRNAFYELWTKLPGLVNQDQAFLDCLKQEFLGYLQSNIWEAKNRDHQIIPTLEEYRIQRPLFSGGQLAISLTPLGMETPLEDIKDSFLKSRELRDLAAKLIYLTNDLFSYEKEKDLGDFHNLLILKKHHQTIKEEQAREEIVEEHKESLKEFLHKSVRFETSEDLYDREILNQIQYKISGAASWSLYDTTRYLKMLNESD